MNNPDTEKSLFIPAGHNNSILKINCTDDDNDDGASSL